VKIALMAFGAIYGCCRPGNENSMMSNNRVFITFMSFHEIENLVNDKRRATMLASRTKANFFIKNFIWQIERFNPKTAFTVELHNLMKTHLN
jgi:hypothetical protein